MFLKSAVIRQIYRAYSSAYSDYMFLRFDAERRISVYLFCLQVYDNDRLIHTKNHFAILYNHVENEIKATIKFRLCIDSVFRYFEQN